MMNKKQLNNYKLGYREGLLLLLFFITISCKGQVTELSDVNYLKPTHKVVDSNLVEILDFMLTDSEFNNWQRNKDKLLLISSIEHANESNVRAITLYSNKQFIKYVPSNYSAYFMYKDVFVVYYGNELIFLKPTKNKIVHNIFEMQDNVAKLDDKNDNNVINISNPEYYGAQFSIVAGNVRITEKNWFGSPIIQEN